MRPTTGNKQAYRSNSDQETTVGSNAIGFGLHLCGARGSRDQDSGGLGLWTLATAGADMPHALTNRQRLRNDPK